MFVDISAGVAKLDGQVDLALVMLPVPMVGRVDSSSANEGTTEARTQLNRFIELAEAMVLELSDGAAVLGAGTRAAVANVDAAEEEIMREFDFLTSSVPVN